MFSSLLAVDRAHAEQRARREGARLGAAVGDLLVARAAQLKKAPTDAERVRVPVNAIAAADEAVDHLARVVKAEGWVSDARLADAERLAEAVAAPVPRAAFQPPPGRSPVVPASESPEFTAATTGAATTAGTMPEELAAALASGSASRSGRLAEKGALDAIRHAHAKPVRAGSNPPRFRR